jgi:hypothetical protein
MKAIEDKQEKAARQFQELKPKFLELLLGAPSYGITSIKIHWMEGEVKRIVVGYKESIMLEENENSCRDR